MNPLTISYLPKTLITCTWKNFQSWNLDPANCAYLCLHHWLSVEIKLPSCLPFSYLSRAEKLATPYLSILRTSWTWSTPAIIHSLHHSGDFTPDDSVIPSDWQTLDQTCEISGKPKPAPPRPSLTQLSSTPDSISGKNWWVISELIGSEGFFRDYRAKLGISNASCHSLSTITTMIPILYLHSLAHSSPFAANVFKHA